MSEDMNINIDSTQGQFRSRLNSLPLEFKCEIGEIPLQKGLRATSRKEKVIEPSKAEHSGIRVKAH